MKIILYASPFFLFPCAPFPALNVSKRYQAFFSLKAKISLLEPLRKNILAMAMRSTFSQMETIEWHESVYLWHKIKKSLEIVHIAPGPVSSFSTFNTKVSIAFFIPQIPIQARMNTEEFHVLQYHHENSLPIDKDRQKYKRSVGLLCEIIRSPTTAVDNKYQSDVNIDVKSLSL